MIEIIDSFTGEYAFLSNFYLSQITSQDGKIYPTVEHYFQAMKTLEIDEHEAIRTAPTPGECKRLGRRCHLRSDWEQVKDAIMYVALQKKFAIPELKEQLLATGDEFLVEGNHWNDTYWGVCNGKGKNRLGFLLMRIREEIKNDTSNSTI